MDTNHVLEWLDDIHEGDKMTVAEINDYVDKWIRDPNLGLYRSDIKVRRVVKVRGRYRISLQVSESAAKAIVSQWGGGCYYKFDGRKYVTKA